MSNYETEARARWGDTDAYCEHAEKTKIYTEEKWDFVAQGMDAVFTRFAACKTGVDSAEAQALVAELQCYITEHFYRCTDEILYGLGQMYVADERFKKNIDKHGDGTAEFVCNAIAAFCGGK